MTNGSTRGRLKQAIHWVKLIILFGMILVISGCSGASGLLPTETGSEDITQTITPVLPTATSSPEPSATATPFVSIREGESVPAEIEVISAKNIKNLQEIGRWGNGVAYAVEWSPNEETIAVSTSRYMLLIDMQSMDISQRIPLEFPLYRIAFSPDGRTIYGGGTQGKLLLYDIQEESQEMISLGTVLPITAVAVSHNGEYVLSADWQKAVQLWNMETDVLKPQFATTLSGSLALGFSNNDELAFTWSPIEPIKGWHMHTAEAEEEFYFGMDANQRTGTTVRFSADGNAAAVNQTWQMRVQNLTNGTTIGLLKNFNKEVLDLDITGNGEWTISLHTDQVRLWESAKSKVISSFDLSDLLDQFPVKIRISPDGSQFVLLGQDLIFFEIDQETQEIMQTEVLPLNLATDLNYDAVCTTENMLYQVGLDGSLHEVDLQSGDTLQNLLSTDNQVSAYTISESMIAVGYGNRTIELLDMTSLEVDKILRGLSHVPLALLVSTEYDMLVAQTGQGTTGIWQTSSGNYLSKQDWDIALDDLQLSYGERYLVGSGAGQTQIYDFADESISEVIDGRLLTVNQDGLLLQPYKADRRLQLLNPASMNVVEHLAEVRADSAVYSPDGKLLVFSGKALFFWDTEQAEIVLQIENPARGAELFFSADGRILLFVNADGSMLLYSVPA
ncbi:MAG: WD40 repeat domain-containing protein [Anaerolineaceae bacterium]|nr:WD40 repeat domain-containing protein [Anaerolineaceae bacterium]